MYELRLLLIVISLICFVERSSAQDLSALYEKVKPGVAVILTEEKELVFGNGGSQERSVGGLGTGFLISDTEIITAAHVVHTVESLKIEFNDGEVIPGKVVSAFKNADVALVKLVWPKKNAVILEFANSDEMKIGNQVFVVGAPMGLENSLSSGYISGKIKGDNANNPFVKSEYFQTDASINTGNSGGPMFNMQGKVVGIVSHILTQSGGFEGLGFAATSNIAKQLLFEDRVMWTGLDGIMLSGELAKLFNLPQASGFLVQKVVFDSPLGLLGLEGGKFNATIEEEELLLGGDIILSLNAIPISLRDEDLTALAASVKDFDANSPLEVKVLRMGKEVTLKR
jgi:serine protease Do